jgi:hypothetical protein
MGLSKTSRVLIIACFAGVFCCGAGAGEFVAAPNLGDLVLDLDTADGKYSAWEVHDLRAIDAVRTTLQVHRLGDDPRWAPTFTINISTAVDSAIFQILSATRQPPLSMHATHRVDKSDVDEKIFTTTLGLDQKLEVSVDWTAGGEVTIRLGSGESYTVQLKGPPTSLQFTDSTGEFELNPLRLGRVQP